MTLQRAVWWCCVLLTLDLFFLVVIRLENPIGLSIARLTSFQSLPRFPNPKSKTMVWRTKQLSGV